VRAVSLEAPFGRCEIRARELRSDPAAQLRASFQRIIV
jgi:hypothetical protein